MDKTMRKRSWLRWIEGGRKLLSDGWILACLVGYSVLEAQICLGYSGQNDIEDQAKKVLKLVRYVALIVGAGAGGIGLAAKYAFGGDQHELKGRALVVFLAAAGIVIIESILGMLISTLGGGSITPGN